VASLNVWMNGELVGEWALLRTGTSVFRYAREWLDSRYVRALSLSLPITADREIRGAVVESYFDNLLPDSADIRRRMRVRYKTSSISPFDLLLAAGRDCVGAVQILPTNDTPEGWNRIEATKLNEGDIERQLTNITALTPLAREDDADFRISIAGAQEKTALLRMAGKWFLPRGATPTTHILKLPLGIIAGFRGDFSDSVENEWLCAQILRELGLPVADATIESFGQVKALVVERFDRRWIGVDAQAAQKARFTPTKGTWIARLPQEDFCQATGIPPSNKYESDGGPSMDDVLGVLSGSENAADDKATFALAQLAFWLLAATDGHAKNFSLHHASGGSFRMTPLYDVLSVWPIVGSRANQWPLQRVKLAMALRGRKRHYKLAEIQTRHWQELATFVGSPKLWERMRTLVESLDDALQRVETSLPQAFPARLFASIANGMRSQARRFLTG
jgi:serine/threonine-protein kinase HipA